METFTEPARMKISQNSVYNFQRIWLRKINEEYQHSILGSKISLVVGFPLGSLAKNGFPLLICISVFLNTKFFTSSIRMKWIGLLMSEYYNRHNRLASACRWSNLSSVFRPSIKGKIGIREAITKQREKRLPISYLALKLRHINKTHTESGVEKSLFQFSLRLLI